MNINKHEIPKLFFRFPWIINIIHGWNRVLLLRNWNLFKFLKTNFDKGGITSVLDAGCGDGQFLFWIDKNYPSIELNAVDKGIENVHFCNHYLQKTIANVDDLNKLSFQKKVDQILAIAVFHYLDDDQKSLQELAALLTNKGSIVIQSPINGRSVLPFYQKFLNRFNHYEVVQKRKKVYTIQEWYTLAEKTGLTVVEEVQSVGTLGIVAHEIYSSAIAVNSHFKHPIVVFIIATIFICSVIPVVILLNFLDFYWSFGQKNGVVLKLQKP